MMIDKNFRGIYLIQEKGCLNPYSGAFHHISMGISELSRYFKIELRLNHKKIDLFDQNNKSNKIVDVEKRGYVYGTLKDLFIFFENLSKLPKLINLCKYEKSQFIYERMSYLDFSGLIASKYLRIPHFYEANGLQFQSKKKYYKSFFLTFAKALEKLSLKLSNHTFFVGSYGDYWNIKLGNWTNVENGIEKDKILPYDAKLLKKEVLDIYFIGKLMKHQRLDVLVNALKILGKDKAIMVHLIGGDLTMIENEIKKIGVNVKNHGFVDRINIIPLIKKFDLGVICGSPEYQSCMKLFDYGASGSAIIAPNVYNLKLWFPNEIKYFDGTPRDLAQKLEFFIKKREALNSFGKLIYDSILNNFFWEKIFKLKAEIIKSHLR